ncbi:uncharacterized protein LOC127780685 [Oryza glaberrima]|uniref:At1g61320/AtMIF1 LRR domain-containing protein n=1 Tax=Oryza glaberrima TaxID=4538 RepID=I1QBS7_ORYGL|nr:uncharacterized protein LOC127780685 [Oryza glaberrima]
MGNLGVREAGRMAVLSRRWRRLPGLLPRLVIDAREFEPAALRAGGHARTKRAMERVAGAVESLLPGDRAIERLRLDAYLLRDESYTVRRVVERLNDAVDSGKVAAGGLELVFRATGGGAAPDQDQPSKRQARRLARLLAAAASPSLLPSVAELSLVNLRFTSPALASLLGRCTGLEELGMYQSDAGFGAVLDVGHARLRRLAVHAVDEAMYKKLRVSSAPRLERVVVANWFCRYAPVSFGHVPCLRELHLKNKAVYYQEPVRLSKMLASIPHLESLTLGFSSWRIWIEPEAPKQLEPMFSKLKSLVLTGIFRGCDLSWTLFFLQAAPFLEEFILEVDKPLDAKAPSDIYGEMPKTDDVTWQVPEFQHHHLKHLEFSGFNEEEMHWRIVELVKERAVNLQSIALDDGCQACDVVANEYVLSGGIKNKKPVLLSVSQITGSPPILTLV